MHAICLKHWYIVFCCASDDQQCSDLWKPVIMKLLFKKKKTKQKTPRSIDAIHIGQRAHSAQFIHRKSWALPLKGKQVIYSVY